MPAPKIFVPRGQFQTDGIDFQLDHSRCQFNVAMGLGKTVMTLTALDHLYAMGETHPTLIVAPLRVAMDTWSDEVKKWKHLAHLTVSPIVGTPKQREEALKKDAHIHTINFENLVWLEAYWGKKWPYKIVVADESTRLKGARSYFRKSKAGKTFLMSAGGARARVLARIAHTKVDYWYNLTGTFTSEGLHDLWGQMWFIDKGERLGRTFGEFSQRWFRQGFNGFGLDALPYAEKEIMAAVSDVVFTLRAEDYLDLPEQVDTTIEVTLPAKAMKLYKQMEKELYLEIRGKEVEAFSAAAKSGKCRQIANGAIYYDKKQNWEAIHDAKILALESVIAEANGKPIIVVYSFKSDLTRLEKAFPEGKKFDKKPETKASFIKGEIPQLFLHPDSAAHGVDGLQHATNITCFFSLPWGHEAYEQTIARAGRVRRLQAGYEGPVFVYKLIAKGTVDEDVQDGLDNKRSVSEALSKGLSRRNKK